MHDTVLVQVLKWLQAFLAVPAIRVIVGLIALDVALGIASAWRRHVFDWQRIVDFYWTMVLPMLFGYTVLYNLMPLLSPAMLGPWGEWLTNGGLALAWVAIIARLVKSIYDNFLEIFRPEEIPTPETLPISGAESYNDSAPYARRG